MVEERSLVKHRLKRLLDQSDLDTLVLCEDWLRKRLAASREPCGFNRNPTGSKDRCAVCRVCGGHRPGSNTAEEKEPWNTTVLATGEVVSRGAVCVPCLWSKDHKKPRANRPHWEACKSGIWQPNKRQKVVDKVL